MSELENMLRLRLERKVLNDANEQNAVYTKNELEAVVTYKMGLVADRLAALVEEAEHE